MWSLVCLLGTLASASCNIRHYYADAESPSPGPEFPGIDPEIVQAAFSNAPVSSSVTPSTAFSPPGSSSYSGSFNPLSYSSEYSSSSPGLPSSSSPYSSLHYEVLYSQSAPPSQPVSMPYSQTSQEFPPYPPPSSPSYSPPVLQPFPVAFSPPSHNIIDIPESAVIPISTVGNLSPSPGFAPTSSQHKAPYAPSSPHSVYGPPGYTPPPVLAGSTEREDERYLNDSPYQLNNGPMASSSETGQYKFRDLTLGGTARINMGAVRVPVRRSYPFVLPRDLKLNHVIM